MHRGIQPLARRYSAQVQRCAGPGGGTGGAGRVSELAAHQRPGGLRGARPRGNLTDRITQLVVGAQRAGEVRQAADRGPGRADRPRADTTQRRPRMVIDLAGVAGLPLTLAGNLSGGEPAQDFRPALGGVVGGVLVLHLGGDFDLVGVPGEVGAAGEQPHVGQHELAHQLLPSPMTLMTRSAPTYCVPWCSNQRYP